jgi:hypothetical protein
MVVTSDSTVVAKKEQDGRALSKQFLQAHRRSVGT